MAFQLKLKFGLLAEPMTDQLRKLGIDIDEELEKVCKQWDIDSEYTTRLKIRSVLAASEANRARDRILKSVEKYLVVNEYINEVKEDA